LPDSSQSSRRSFERFRASFFARFGSVSHGAFVVWHCPVCRVSCSLLCVALCALCLSQCSHSCPAGTRRWSLPGVPLRLSLHAHGALRLSLHVPTGPRALPLIEAELLLRLDPFDAHMLLCICLCLAHGLHCTLSSRTLPFEVHGRELAFACCSPVLPPEPKVLLRFILLAKWAGTTCTISLATALYVVIFRFLCSLALCFKSLFRLPCKHDKRMKCRLFPFPGTRQKKKRKTQQKSEKPTTLVRPAPNPSSPLLSFPCKRYVFAGPGRIAEPRAMPTSFLLSLT